MDYEDRALRGSQSRSVAPNVRQEPIQGGRQMHGAKNCRCCLAESREALREDEPMGISMQLGCKVGCHGSPQRGTKDEDWRLRCQAAKMSVGGLSASVDILQGEKARTAAVARVVEDKGGDPGCCQDLLDLPPEIKSLSNSVADQNQSGCRPIGDC